MLLLEVEQFVRLGETDGAGILYRNTVVLVCTWVCLYIYMFNLIGRSAFS